MSAEAPLGTVVTITLTPKPSGTRVRPVKPGFRLPRDATTYTRTGWGWKDCAE